MALTFGAILLAAGRSTRMGTPKALLHAGGASFFDEARLAIAASAPTRSVLVTNDDLHDQLAPKWGGHAIVNAAPRSPQFDSLRLALQDLAKDPLDGAAVLLVDNPGRVTERLRGLLVAAARNPLEPLVVAFRGKPGHPLWLPARFWPSVLAWDGTEGLRGWFAHAAVAPRPVDLGIAEALSDLDTPSDLAAYQQAMEQQ